MSDYRPDLFAGNEDAARMVADLCFVAHVWDDLIDKDKIVPDSAINGAFEKALFSIPNNPFFVAHRSAISPLIYTGILGFLSANVMEKSGDPHQIEIAHGLRYSVAQVAVFAVAATNQRSVTELLLPEAWRQWMPERFADYAKEHGYAE